jgi:hypothetical protein
VSKSKKATFSSPAETFPVLRPTQVEYFKVNLLDQEVPSPSFVKQWIKPNKWGETDKDIANLRVEFSTFYANQQNLQPKKLENNANEPKKVMVLKPPIHIPNLTCTPGRKAEFGVLLLLNDYMANMDNREEVYKGLLLSIANKMSLEPFSFMAMELGKQEGGLVKLVEKLISLPTFSNFTKVWDFTEDLVMQLKPLILQIIPYEDGLGLPDHECEERANVMIEKVFLSLMRNYLEQDKEIGFNHIFVRILGRSFTSYSRALIVREEKNRCYQIMNVFLSVLDFRHLIYSISPMVVECGDVDFKTFECENQEHWQKMSALMGRYYLALQKIKNVWRTQEELLKLCRKVLKTVLKDKQEFGKPIDDDQMIRDVIMHLPGDDLEKMVDKIIKDIVGCGA